MLALPFRHEGDDRETRRLRRVRGWPRRRYRWLLPLFAAFLGLAISAIQAGMAGLQLAHGRDDLLAGRFQKAEAEFTDARDGLQHNPLLGLVGLVPAARRQVDALELLADMGARASHAARIGVAAVRGQDLGRLRQ